MPTARFSSKNKLGTTGARMMKTDLSLGEKVLPTSSRQYPWKVTHACELAREVLPLVEGQLAAGMRPSLLTPGAFAAANSLPEAPKRESSLPISLFDTWNHVREWRKLLNDSAAETSSEIIHAHSFSAGMAAVRSPSCVVYQLKQTVEKLAAAAGNCNENSWLARSFRVAEQFVLSRAAAVVVHTHRGRLACLDRGVNAANLFLLPEPIEHSLLESAPERNWLMDVAGAGPETVFLVIPGLPHSSEWECRDALLRWMRVLSNVRREYADVRFVFLAEAQATDAIHEIGSACNLRPWICALSFGIRDKVLASADIVICEREHAARGMALETLARGRALLAADVEQHRDISPDGRGCLWFRSGEVGDIAHRAGFLAGNPQFRRALASAGRDYCLATHSPEVVASQYDAVYRLAFSKRKGRDNSTPKAQFIPLQVAS